MVNASSERRDRKTWGGVKGLCVCVRVYVRVLDSLKVLKVYCSTQNNLRAHPLSIRLTHMLSHMGRMLISHTYTDWHIITHISFSVWLKNSMSVYLTHSRVKRSYDDPSSETPLDSSFLILGTFNTFFCTTVEFFCASNREQSHTCVWTMTDPRACVALFT